MYLLYLAYKIWKYSAEPISMDIKLENDLRMDAYVFEFAFEYSRPRILLGLIPLINSSRFFEANDRIRYSIECSSQKSKNP